MITLRNRHLDRRRRLMFGTVSLGRELFASRAWVLGRIACVCGHINSCSLSEPLLRKIGEPLGPNLHPGSWRSATVTTRGVRGDLSDHTARSAVVPIEVPGLAPPLPVDIAAAAPSASLSIALCIAPWGLPVFRARARSESRVARHFGSSEDGPSLRVQFIGMHRDGCVAGRP